MLAIAIPLLLATTLIWRPEVPPTTDLDPSLRRSAGIPADGEWNPRVIDTGRHTFEVQIRGDSGGEGLSLVIRPTSVILKPDLLVYWSPGDDVTGQPSDDAVLVGSLSGRSRRLLQLPAAADSGTLIVYSLPHQQVVDRISLQTALAAIGPGE